MISDLVFLLLGTFSSSCLGCIPVTGAYQTAGRANLVTLVLLKLYLSYCMSIA